MQKEKSDFYHLVYEVVRLIPSGRVSTYGAIARYLGSPQASRTVGYAMNKCSSYKHPVPAHRVVNRNGQLTGKHHFPGSDLMENLLENEGIKVVDDTIIDFKNLFWDPNTELL